MPSNVKMRSKKLRALFMPLGFLMFPLTTDHSTPSFTRPSHVGTATPAHLKKRIVPTQHLYIEVLTNHTEDNERDQHRELAHAAAGHDISPSRFPFDDLCGRLLVLLRCIETNGLHTAYNLRFSRPHQHVDMDTSVSLAKDGLSSRMDEWAGALLAIRLSFLLPHPLGPRPAGR